MKPRIAIQITVPEPCSQLQHWDSMKPAEGGKHCGQCRQTVVDFTRMTDAQLIAYIQQHPTGCGRYREDQLGYDIVEPQVPAARPVTKWLIGVVMVCFGWMKEGLAQKSSRHKIKAPAISQTPVPRTLAAAPCDSPQTIPPAANPVLIDSLKAQEFQRYSNTGISVGGARVSGVRYIIDGVQLPPGAATDKKKGPMPAPSVEPAGRKTIQGKDLPHSFRLNEE